MKVFVYHIYSPEAGVTLSAKAYADHESAYEALIKALEDATGIAHNGDDQEFFNEMSYEGIDGKVCALDV